MQQFREWAVLNGDEVAINLNYDVNLAKTWNMKRIPSVSTGAANKMLMMRTFVLGNE